MAGNARLYNKDEEEISEQESAFRLNNKIFIFVMVLATSILVVDYVLVVNFIDIIKKI